MLTTKDFEKNFKKACKEGDYPYNKDSLDDGIEFMFDVYACQDQIDLLDNPEDYKDLSEKDVEKRAQKALETLQSKGSFEDDLIEALIKNGFENNFDEIREGGEDSSIGGIIIDMDEMEDDEEDDTDDEEDDE